MNLGKLITQYRKDANMTIDELADKSGVPKGTLNKIITGITKAPTLETVRAIAYALGKTLNDFDDSRKPEGLSREELSLIKKYRALDEHGKEIVDSCLDIEHRRMEEQEQEESNVIALPRFWNRPSAGNGNELGDGDYDVIEVPDTLTARIASYALTVSGHSMEPEIMDGETVLVKKLDHFEKGDIVVFSLNDQSYIKRAGEKCFESINPDYEDVTPTEDDDLHIFGVVVGKV